MLVASGVMAWIVWTQRPVPVESADPAPVPVAESAAPSEAPAPAPIDEARVEELQSAAEQAPDDAQVRVDLGNLYFDAQRFEEAIPWFDAALALGLEEVQVSTNLGVAYFYTDDVDQSLAQFERSLELDPTHGQTLLSIGIVRAFGKQDFDGAIEVWEEVQRLMPGSREAIAAADAIEQMRSMHP
jgi:tetratricopeptide (TPR) repeat protein